MKLWKIVLFILIPISMIVNPVRAEEGIWYEDITPQEYVDKHDFHLPEDLKKYLDNPNPDLILIPSAVNVLDGWQTVIVTYAPVGLVKNKKLGDVIYPTEKDNLARARFCTCEKCKQDGKDSLCSFEIFSKKSGWLTLYQYIPPKKERLKPRFAKKRDI